MTTFGIKLKALREAAGLTQEALATPAGMHKLTVAKLEQGIREPGWETVQALARVLGVSTEALRTDTGERVEDNRPGPRGRPRGDANAVPVASPDTRSGGKAGRKPTKGKKG